MVRSCRLIGKIAGDNPLNVCSKRQKMETTREIVANLMDIDLSDDSTKIERTKTGIFTVRKGYYWHPKSTPDESFARQIAFLEAAGVVLDAVEYGDCQKSFKGDRGVKHNSHFWVKFRTKTM